MSSTAIKIHHLKNFDSNIQVMNANLVSSPVSFSGWGDKLLEKQNVQAILWGSTVCVDIIVLLVLVWIGYSQIKNEIYSYKISNY